VDEIGEDVDLRLFYTEGVRPKNNAYYKRYGEAGVRLAIDAGNTLYFYIMNEKNISDSGSFTIYYDQAYHVLSVSALILMIT